MKRDHLSDTELAQLGAMESTGSIGNHLRWCARCRSVLADYRWLHRELAATLTAAADTVVVPRPTWQVVRSRLLVDQRQRVAGWRASVLASAVLAVCFMLLAPILVSPAGMAQGPQLQAAVVVAVPTPTEASVAHHHWSLAATPTPSAFGDEALCSTPGVELFPTPTEPGV
jgi:hypothetical protein